MSNQSERETSRKQDKQSQSIDKSANIVEQVGNQASLAGLSSSFAGAGDAGIQGHASQLSNPNIPVLQRQAMARQIGQVGDNVESLDHIPIKKRKLSDW